MSLQLGSITAMDELAWNAYGSLHDGWELVCVLRALVTRSGPRECEMLLI